MKRAPLDTGSQAEDSPLPRPGWLLSRGALEVSRHLPQSQAAQPSEEGVLRDVPCPVPSELSG